MKTEPNKIVAGSEAPHQAERLRPPGVSAKIASLFAIAILTTGVLLGANTYFPEHSVSDFEQAWYAKHLSAMKEPVLAVKKEDDSYFAIRVLYLPTWGRPVAVRIEKNGDSVIRRAVMLSGEGGYSPGEIKKNEQSSLAAQEFAALLGEIEKSDFWKLEPVDQIVGTDGSRLVIQAIQDGKHVVLVRWTPEYKTEARGLAGLVSLSNRLFQEVGFWKKE